MALRTLDSLGPLAGTRVIVRCDLNVPLKDGVITDEAPIYVSRRYFETLGRSHIKPGHLLFSIMASIGNCAVVPDGYPDATANRAVGILVPKSKAELVTAYIAFLFETELGTGLYARIKKGGLQQRTNLADVERLQFPIPPPAIQRELVDAMEAARIGLANHVVAPEELMPKTLEI